MKAIVDTNVILDALTGREPWNKDAEDCMNALHSHINDFEYAVLSEVAKRNGVDYIITRNIKDYVNSSVK